MKAACCRRIPGRSSEYFGAHLSTLVKVAFASGTHGLNPQLVNRLAEIYPELPLYVVSEFAPARGEWIPYHPYRGWTENMSACREALAGKRVRLAAVLLVPRVPYRRMRLMALVLSPRGFLAYNENLDSFMLRPRCLAAIGRHMAWRCANFFRWHAREESPWRRNPGLRMAVLRATWSARLAGIVRGHGSARYKPSESPLAGISVVAASGNSGELRPEVLASLEAEGPDEIITVASGNAGSGLQRARYTHVLLLEEGVAIRRGLLQELRRAFEEVPSLFCAAAQMLLADGGTGKGSWKEGIDFPARSEMPVVGEDLTYILYGSGGCALYRADKLRGFDMNGSFDGTGRVARLEASYRAWLQGWPSVFVPGAQAEQLHSGSFLSGDVAGEAALLRFAVSLGAGEMWRGALRRLEARGAEETLAGAWKLPWTVPKIGRAEAELFALGDVAVFPGRKRSGNPVVMVATPYLPFPLAHGGAVRIFHLMSRAASNFDQVMISFCDELASPPPELLDICVEIVMVRRAGTHYRRSSERPDMVDELASAAYRGALKQSVKKWSPALVQLEFTPMAQYAECCRPAKTVLVEHDITFDLHQQLVQTGATGEARRQLEKWRVFEKAAWAKVDRVVTVSEKDREVAGGGGASAVCLNNGVDLARYQPALSEPEPGRLLFIGSFTHLPNLLALEYFLAEVWPLLDDLSPVLHVIAGARHEYYMEFHRKAISGVRVEIEGFVADVRLAYARASVVIAPLTASAGTNIKILEAMAMGKAIVSTPAGVNGLDVANGLLLAGTPAAFADCVRACLKSRDKRGLLGAAARAIVEQGYGWDSIGVKQRAMYDSLLSGKAT